MRDYHFTCVLLGFSLVYADIMHRNTLYYVTPVPTDPCPRDSSCLTITQLAVNSTNIYGDENNVSLYFLTGNHILDCQLSLTGGNHLSITKYTQRSGTVTIQCSRYSGRFVINNTASVSIKGLHFFGCGGNTVNRVKEFSVQDTTFDGMESSGSALVINEVISAKIVSTSFLRNTPGVESVKTLHTTFSNVAVISSKFMHNLGGAIFGQNIRLHIGGSTFCDNNDGVLFTSESTVNVDNSTFCNNIAYGSGGVMVSRNDSITVNRSIFYNNYAGHGGVMDASNDCTCTITSSTFTNNRANKGGGVITTNGRSSFFIFSSTFINNRAEHGGVLVTYSMSKVIVSSNTFTIISSSFINNSVKGFGGVVATFRKSFFNITNSNFTEDWKLVIAPP